VGTALEERWRCLGTRFLWSVDGFLKSLDASNCRRGRMPHTNLCLGEILPLLDIRRVRFFPSELPLELVTLDFFFIAVVFLDLFCSFSVRRFFSLWATIISVR